MNCLRAHNEIFLSFFSLCDSIMVHSNGAALVQLNAAFGKSFPRF